jgi:hypothetical protein
VRLRFIKGGGWEITRTSRWQTFYANSFIITLFAEIGQDLLYEKIGRFVHSRQESAATPNMAIGRALSIRGEVLPEEKSKRIRARVEFVSGMIRD